MIYVLRRFQLSFQDGVPLCLDRLGVGGDRLVVLFRRGVDVFVRPGVRLPRLQRLLDVVLLN